MVDDKDQKDVPRVSKWPRGFTRREFLFGTGAFVYLAVDYANAQEPLPKFIYSGGMVSLSWGTGLANRTWHIDPDWFVAEIGHRRKLRLIGPQTLDIRGRLAGVNISVNFRILIVAHFGSWALEWHEGGRKLGTIALHNWFAGTEMPISLSRLSSISSSRGALELTGQLDGTLRWPFSFRLRAQGAKPVGINLGQTLGTAQSIVVDAYNVPASDAPESRPVLTENVASLLPATAVGKVRVTAELGSLDTPTGGWALGKLANNELHLMPQLAKVIVEVVKNSANDDLMVVWRHLSSGEARIVIGTTDGPQTLFVDGAEFIEVLGGRYGLACAATRHPRLTKGGGFLAFVRGNGREHFFTDFRDAHRISLPLILQTLHVRGEDRARYDIDFRRHDAAGAYLDRSSVIWEQQAVDGVDAVLTLGTPPAIVSGNQLHLGSHSVVDVLLHVPGEQSLNDNGPILRVRRHEDALDLGLLFQGYRLTVNKAGAWLVSIPNAQRGARFHPQHLQEEVFEFPGGGKGKGDDDNTIRHLGEDALFAGPGITTKLARTRISGASRVIFSREKPSRSLRLSVESLTDWSGLQLAVPKRADLANQPLDEQIEGIGITTDMERDAAKHIIARSLVSPGSDETALELVTGLVFSPDRSARFRIPRHVPSERGPLWTAQLELQPIKLHTTSVPPPLAKVRAVWASGFEADWLFGGDCSAPSPSTLEAPFESSLSAQHRTEIMLLSSGIGLAALRAVTLAGQDVPYSLVRIPRKHFEYVDDRKPAPPTVPGSPQLPAVQQEGVMAPAPFSRFNARLTAYGADLDAEWSGEPVAPLGDNPFFNRAFTVEKYIHRTSLGSDVFVEVVFKAFLFPYGFRVTLVRVVEREPWNSSDMGAMLPAVRRYFILPKPVDKTFPGIYQPFQGLEIPVRHARLAFEISPEIDATQMDSPLGLPQIPTPADDKCGSQAKYQGQVFWPKQKGLGTDILFDFIADDTGVRRSVPMLFVDNAAVHHPPTMRAVVDYYNSLDVEPLRKELHYGGKTIYAAPGRLGDTSFETDHIILKARSRVVADPDNAEPGSDSDAAFVMDAYMEGADEPPFYPVMVEASIRVPALDRLLGEPQGLKSVGYVGHYIQHGFDSRTNPSQLFLCFLKHGLMDLNGKGKVSGGVSQSPTAIASISRTNAIVGAKSRPLIEGEVSATKVDTPSVGSDARAPWDLSDTIADRFNPGDFFRDAKLLGIINFAEVVKAGAMSVQPKLKEVYDYAVAEVSSNVHDVLKDACTTAAEAIGSALKQAEAALVAFFESEPNTAWVLLSSEPNSYPNLEKCYPDLTRRLIELARQLTEAAGSRTLEDLIGCASKIMESWRSVKGAVDAVIANPSPEPIRGVIGELRVLVDAWQGKLGNALRNEFEKQLRQLVDPIIKAVLDHCFEAGKPVRLWLFDAFFGALRPLDTEPGTPPKVPTIDEMRDLVLHLLDHPNEIPPVVLAAPLSKSVTLPLLSLMASLRRIPETIDNSEVDKAVELARGVLQDMLELVASGQALLEAAGANVAALCETVTSPLPKLAELVETCLPAIPDIANAMRLITDRMDQLDLPGLGRSPEVDQVRRTAAGLRAAIQKVATQFVEIDTVRQRFTAGVAEWCVQPGRMAVDVGELIRSRTSTLDAIKACPGQAGDVAQALRHIPEAYAGVARKALHDVRRELVILCYRATIAAFTEASPAGDSVMTARIDLLPDKIRARLSLELAVVLKDGHGLATNVDNFLKYGDSDAGIDQAFSSLTESASLFIASEKGLFTLATDFTALYGDLHSKVEQLSGELAKKVGRPLIDLHQNIYDQADQAIGTIKAAPELVLLLSRSVLARLELVRNAVKRDLDSLKAILQDPSKAMELLGRWRGGEAALVMAARTLSELFFAVARGQIGALFNLDEARRAIEDVVRRLIPSRVTMSYEWSATLLPVPANNPIFIPTGSQGDLVISTKIDIDLLKPAERTVNVKGELQPFDVHLWGDVVDLATLSFKDTNFYIVNGGAPKFTTHVEKVTIGSDLTYLQKLQSLLSTSDRGFSLAPSFDPPGIRVGYSLAEPIVQMGGLTILNLGFEIFALLPFDGSQAQLGFSLGSRAQPFGIIVLPCYYGGGFISLMTNAKEVIRFEIQLEFGAATAIQFGPLSGQGRVTSGIYLMAEGDQRSILEGFVHAVGEGQVACFGICVNLEVRIKHINGSVTGDAKYQFSFRVGLIELSYQVTASYTFKGDGAASQLACESACYPYALEAPNKVSEWEKYRAHFVEVWT
ncbi:hypothetical protein KW834_22875 [Pseudomonas sp. PDM29]|uniref:hypothetical protein n=1 Tax=Pseudomonas sp. PDM29 TaxID=2854771 RepID=UPI001C48208C|nr:hypothetical protein [Pseudomonas sp. PDM29]MBV7527258.1 hypothetical protein [Pseudomonas sp. PDM29]